MALDYSADGILYANDNGTDSLLMIDLGLGIANLVGPYTSGFSHNNIAFAPVVVPIAGIAPIFGICYLAGGAAP